MVTEDISGIAEFYQVLDPNERRYAGTVLSVSISVLILEAGETYKTPSERINPTVSFFCGVI